MTPLRVRFVFDYRSHSSFCFKFCCTELKKNGRTYDVTFYSETYHSGEGFLYATISNSKAFMKAFGDGFRDIYPDWRLRFNPRMSVFKKLVRPLVRQVLEEREERLERLRRLPGNG